MCRHGVADSQGSGVSRGYRVEGVTEILVVKGSEVIKLHFK